MPSKEESDEGGNGKAFNYTLLENAIHSYNNGKNKLKKYQDQQNQWDLKEAIIFIHNGMELFLKHILAQHNEFLIFENVDKAASAKIRAKQQGISIFELDNYPNTVKFPDAVDRVEAIYDGSDTNLFDLLKVLNKKRNQIEHYGGGLNGSEVYELLNELSEKIPSFLSKYDIKTREVETVFSAISSLSSLLISNYKFYEFRTANLMSNFKNQEVDGKLFGVPNTKIFLPHFTRLLKGNQRGYGFKFDFDLVGLGKTGKRWIAEVKAIAKPDLNSLSRTLDILLSRSEKDDIIWLTLYSELSKEALHKLRRMLDPNRTVYISTKKDIEEIEKIVMTDNKQGKVAE